MKPVPAVAALRPGQAVEVPAEALAELAGEARYGLTAIERVRANLVGGEQILVEDLGASVRFTKPKTFRLPPRIHR